MDLVPWRRVQTGIHRYNGDCTIQTYPRAEKFRVMSLAQTYRYSLREAGTRLRAVPSGLFHLPFYSSISTSNTAHAYQTRDWRILAYCAQILARRAQQLSMGEDLALDIEKPAYALDTTPTDSCLSLVPWAKFRPTKAAVP